MNGMGIPRICGEDDSQRVPQDGALLGYELSILSEKSRIRMVIVEIIKQPTTDRALRKRSNAVLSQSSYQEYFVRFTRRLGTLRVTQQAAPLPNIADDMRGPAESG
ncbi:hypothetical protein VTN96DRAFT_2175 [Rasamsonia emersonii]